MSIILGGRGSKFSSFLNPRSTPSFSKVLHFFFPFPKLCSFFLLREILQKIIRFSTPFCSCLKEAPVKHKNVKANNAALHTFIFSHGLISLLFEL